MENNKIAVLDAIDRIETAAGSAELLRVFSDFVADYGFERYFIGQLVNPLNVPLDKIMYVSDWPDELRARRMKRLAILQDPVVRCALRTKRPFKWSAARKFANHIGLKVLDETREFGLNDGYMFPMYSLDTVPGGVSLGARAMELTERQIAEVELVAQHCYYKLEQVLGPHPYRIQAELSARETEVIQIAAAGKTNWEISRILGLSEDTVKATVARATRKLNTTNRAHAVATAIGQGLIMA